MIKKLLAAILCALITALAVFAVQGAETPKEDISLLTIDSIDDIVYTGVEINPNIIIKNGDSVLTPDFDYDVELSGNTINVGTVTALITGKGLYTGSTSASFNIVPLKIEPDVTICGTGSYKYSGKVIHPQISVEADVNGESTYIPKDCYDIAYSADCKNVGDYFVQIKLKGNYSGTGGADFEILKAKQNIKVKTAVKKVKLSKIRKSKQTVKKAITAENALGKVTYSKVKKGSSKYLTISASGVITVKKSKSLRKNQTLKINVKVKSKGTKNFYSFTKTVAVKVKIK